MTYEWKNKEGKLAAQLEIDEEKGIAIKVDQQTKDKHGKEIEELQTLNLYPPVDEEKIRGVEDDGMTRYDIGKSRKWEFAKGDILATFNFWLGPSTQSD